MEPNLVNFGYTNKLSFTNREKVKLYIDSIKDDDNASLYIQNINGEVVKKWKAKVKNQIKHDNYDMYHYEKGLYEKPWQDFELDFTCEIDISGFKSGIYIINDNIVFIVREHSLETNKAPICCLIGTTTMAMYNYFGGKSSYYSFKQKGQQHNNPKSVKNTHGIFEDMARDGYCNEEERARVVQMNRPFNLYNFFNYNYGLLKFLFNSNYKVNYITDYDLHNNSCREYWDKSSRQKLDLFIISGHSEYWSLESRKNLEKINDNGTNILNLSGNTSWSRINYYNNKIIYQRYPKDFDFIDNTYIPAAHGTSYFCNTGYNSFESLGVDYLDGGHNFKGNKYFNFDNDLKLLNGIDSVEVTNTNSEFDGFKTNFHISEDKIINDIINTPEKIKQFKNLFKLDKKYDKYKYKQILMYGMTPTWKSYKDKTFYHAKSTGIIALKKNENSGIFVNCGYSKFCSKLKDQARANGREKGKKYVFEDIQDTSDWENSNLKKITEIFIKTLVKTNINFNETFASKKTYTCSVCNVEMKPLENRYCHYCGSVERHRCLVSSIKTEKINELLFNEPVLILSEGKRQNNRYYESAYYFNTICKLKTMDIRKYGGTCFRDNQYYDYVHNCEDLSFVKDGTYKAIVVNHVLTAVKNDLTTLSNFNRILKDDGLLIVTDSINPSYKTKCYDSTTSTMCCRLYGYDFVEIMLKHFVKPLLI